jgi:hypothetical protein
MVAELFIKRIQILPSTKMYTQKHLESVLEQLVTTIK